MSRQSAMLHGAKLLNAVALLKPGQGETARALLSAAGMPEVGDAIAAMAAAMAEEDEPTDGWIIQLRPETDGARYFYSRGDGVTSDPTIAKIFKTPFVANAIMGPFTMWPLRKVVRRSELLRELADKARRAAENS